MSEAAYLCVCMRRDADNHHRLIAIGVYSSEALTVMNVQTDYYLTLAYAHAANFAAADRQLRSKLHGTALAQHANVIAQDLLDQKLMRLWEPL